jgi:hypothetical protein
MLAMIRQPPQTPGVTYMRSALFVLVLLAGCGTGVSVSPGTCVDAWAGSHETGGSQLANLTVEDCQGAAGNLRTLAGEARLVLLEVDAGWSDESHNNQPRLQALRQAHAGCLQVVSLLWAGSAVSEPATTAYCQFWEATCAGRDCGELSYPVVLDPTRQLGYLVTGATMPLTLLMDSCGTVLLESFGPTNDLDDLIAAYCE